MWSYSCITNIYFLTVWIGRFLTFLFENKECKLPSSYSKSFRYIPFQLHIKYRPIWTREPLIAVYRLFYNFPVWNSLSKQGFETPDIEFRRVGDDARKTRENHNFLQCSNLMTNHQVSRSAWDNMLINYDCLISTNVSEMEIAHVVFTALN